MTKPPTLASEEQELRRRIKRNMDRVQNVPALSNVVTKIIALADNPTVSGQQVAEVVGKDQSMVTAILKIVNSPFYGLNRRVSSISHAIVLLGYRTIRNVALSTTLLNTFGGRKNKKGLFDRTRCWRHAIATAACAKVLAQRQDEVDAEEAFLAGLIHDMGSIILDHYFSEEFEQALQLSESQGIRLLEAELKTFGMTHAEVGMLIAQKWNFPEPVAAAIGTHHDFDRSVEAGGLAPIIFVANVLSDLALHRAQIAGDGFTAGDEADGETAGAGPAAAGGGAPEVSNQDESDSSVALADAEELRSRLTPQLLESVGLHMDQLDEVLADLEVEMDKSRAFLSSIGS